MSLLRHPASGEIIRAVETPAERTLNLMRSQDHRSFEFPVHPDDEWIPPSILHIALRKEPPCIVTIVTPFGPQAAKSLGLLSEAIKLFKETIVNSPKSEDFSI